MDIGIVSMRYAKALDEFARTTDSEKAMYDAIIMLEHSFSHNQALRFTLGNPMLTGSQKLNIICSAAYGSSKPSEEFTRFISLVLKNKREDMLHFICTSFMTIYRNRHNISKAKLQTAVSVDDETLKRLSNLSEKIFKKYVELETGINPSLIGGFVLDISDYRLDASVSTRLRKMKEKLVSKNKTIE